MSPSSSMNAVLIFVPLFKWNLVTAKVCKTLNMILHFSIMSDEMNSVGSGMKNRKKVEIGSLKLLPHFTFHPLFATDLKRGTLCRKVAEKWVLTQNLKVYRQLYDTVPLCPSCVMFPLSFEL